MLVKVYQLFILDGARFSAIESARAHFAVEGKHPQLFDQVNYPWGGIFLFHTEEGNRTVLAYKKKPNSWFYYAPNATTFDHSKDQDHVRTVGALNAMLDSPGVQACVFAIESSDPNVDSIEIGVGVDRIRKKLIAGQTMIFSWPKYFNNGADLKPVALSKDGKLLYEYRYKMANVTNSDELRWYASNDTLKN